MSDPSQLLQTLYLGDRACTGFHLDNNQRRFALGIDVISRIRTPNRVWNYDSSEDIVNGQMVFENVTELRFEPSGPLPNDYILGINIEAVGDRYRFKIAVASVDDTGLQTSEVLIIVNATSFYLLDPKNPSVEIRT